MITLKQPIINLLDYQLYLKFQKKGKKRLIFDPIRRKYLVLQPEELVRQLFIAYLIHELGYSKNRIAVEKQIKVNTRFKRCDILVYNTSTEPYILIECKAPNIDISQAVFNQIATYNMTLNVPYLVVTNGKTTICSQMNHLEERYDFLQKIPPSE